MQHQCNAPFLLPFHRRHLDLGPHLSLWIHAFLHALSPILCVRTFLRLIWDLSNPTLSGVSATIYDQSDHGVSAFTRFLKNRRNWRRRCRVRELQYERERGARTLFEVASGGDDDPPHHHHRTRVDVGTLHEKHSDSDFSHVHLH